jgi:SNF2 family DNA or RNA helicase
LCPASSYQFAKSKADDIKQIGWDLVVLDEAHRLRNVYKKNNVIGLISSALDLAN